MSSIENNFNIDNLPINIIIERLEELKINTKKDMSEEYYRYKYDLELKRLKYEKILYNMPNELDIISFIYDVINNSIYNTNEFIKNIKDDLMTFVVKVQTVICVLASTDIRKFNTKELLNLFSKNELNMYNYIINNNYNEKLTKSDLIKIILKNINNNDITKLIKITSNKSKDDKSKDDKIIEKETTIDIIDFSNKKISKIKEILNSKNIYDIVKEEKSLYIVLKLLLLNNLNKTYVTDIFNKILNNYKPYSIECKIELIRNDVIYNENIYKNDFLYNSYTKKISFDVSINDLNNKNILTAFKEKLKNIYKECNDKNYKYSIYKVDINYNSREIKTIFTQESNIIEYFKNKNKQNKTFFDKKSTKIEIYKKYINVGKEDYISGYSRKLDFENIKHHIVDNDNNSESNIDTINVSPISLILKGESNIENNELDLTEMILNRISKINTDFYSENIDNFNESLYIILKDSGLNQFMFKEQFYVNQIMELIIAFSWILQTQENKITLNNLSNKYIFLNIETKESNKNINKLSKTDNLFSKELSNMLLKLTKLYK